MITFPPCLVEGAVRGFTPQMHRAPHDITRNCRVGDPKLVMARHTPPNVRWNVTYVHYGPMLPSQMLHCFARRPDGESYSVYNVFSFMLAFVMNLLDAQYRKETNTTSFYHSIMYFTVAFGGLVVLGVPHISVMWMTYANNLVAMNACYA